MVDGMEEEFNTRFFCLPYTNLFQKIKQASSSV